MEENRKLALIISYYLSKFDRKALSNLGYKTFTEAFNDIGERLGVKPNSIKNMRENFDPLHANTRVGWYQRELSISRLEILDKYGPLGEEALTSIVQEILSNYKIDGNINESIQTYINILGTEEEEQPSKSRQYTTRGLTGKRAEDLFIEFFRQGRIEGFDGGLLDKRNDGCGYDFETEYEPKYMFEVKGLMDNKGGIIFTDKEWNTAKELGERYILVFISDIEDSPNVTVIKDPFQKIIAKKNVYTTIAVNWSVGSNQLLN
ncbi:hypothetical protein QFZ77_007633 [Paenibacillus sp. V4I3]|uniref:DUF3883 domain-containing protein n=1 Tax=Paenibacillus sp. V4I3 TaxID=3042305 RepID=UPI002789976E|nr:DUF3883 domain-containing protein [Paenibacillus sp. V4I3]MDQ0878974.1 hypothetical protein [Paenibacillus sp. V4I3]